MPGLYLLAAHAALQEVLAGLPDGLRRCAPGTGQRIVCRCGSCALDACAGPRSTALKFVRGTRKVRNQQTSVHCSQSVRVGDWASAHDQKGLKVRLARTRASRAGSPFKREAHDRWLQVVPAFGRGC